MGDEIFQHGYFDDLFSDDDSSDEKDQIIKDSIEERSDRDVIENVDFGISQKEGEKEWTSKRDIRPVDITIGPLNQENLKKTGRKIGMLYTEPERRGKHKRSPYIGGDKIRKSIPQRKEIIEIFVEGTDNILVRLKKPEHGKGILAMIDGNYHILVGDKIKIANPKFIKNLEHDILSGKITIDYDDVSYHVGSIVKVLGNNRYMVRVSEDGKTHEVSYKELVHKKKGFIAIDDVLSGLRKYLRDNFSLLCQEYKPTQKVDIKYNKEPWVAYYQKNFDAWFRATHYNEAAKMVDKKKVKEYLSDILRENPKEVGNLKQREQEITERMIHDYLETFKPQEGDYIFFKENIEGDLKRKYEEPIPVIDTKHTPVQIKEGVHRYEKIIFDVYGHNLSEYLAHFLFPYIFMSRLSPISKHALFFQTKFRNGSVKIQDLVSLKLPEYIPELYIGHVVKKNDFVNFKEIEEGHEYIKETLRYLSKYIIKSYTSLIDPTLKITGTQTMNRARKELDNLFTSVTSLCEKLEIKDVKICLKKNKFVCELITE